MPKKIWFLTIFFAIAYLASLLGCVPTRALPPLVGFIPVTVHSQKRDVKTSLASPLDVIAPLCAAAADQADCGPRALLLLCQHAGIKTELPALRREAETTAQGTTMVGLALAAQANGFHPKGVQMNPQALSHLSSPAIAWVDGKHYIAVLSIRGGRATIHDPNHLKEETLSISQLWKRSGGILLALSR